MISGSYSISSKPSMRYIVKYQYLLYIVMVWVNLRGTKESKWGPKVTPWYPSNEKKTIEDVYGNEFVAKFNFLKA